MQDWFCVSFGGKTNICKYHINPAARSAFSLHRQVHFLLEIPILTGSCSLVLSLSYEIKILLNNTVEGFGRMHWNTLKHKSFFTADAKSN